ncbi:MAG: hypothetical protein JNL10_18420 [Verrucomicrobiales bacterium]|nr:hypothetical protein [Verrucomicrobiales bacterium]
MVRLLTWLSLWSWGMGTLLIAKPIPDEPFWQDVAVRIRLQPGLESARFRKVCVDREGVVYVLTDRGVARLFEDVLALDRSFRPLAGRIPKDITVSPEGDLYYLFEDSWLSNGRNGRPAGSVTPGTMDRIAVGPAGEVWLSGPGRAARFPAEGGTLPAALETSRSLEFIPGPAEGQLALLADGMLSVKTAGGWSPAVSARAAAWSRDGLWVGTTNGCHPVDKPSSTPAPQAGGPPPWGDVTCIAPVPGGIWFGTTRGAIFQNDGMDPASRYAIPSAPGIPAPRFRYYAGKRWLPDDAIASLAIGRDGTVWVLTPSGLGGIAFQRMTLADKAEWFHRKIRTRNLRLGLTGERRLLTPGDLLTSEIVDTDNDGGWTSYYLGALGAEYAVTRGEAVRREAWESFSALERLQELSTIPGFSARTIERRGFKFSDPDRWREAKDPGWDWKGHTSSDEICSQTFAHAVMWEWVATNATERARIATNYTRIVEHILSHDLYYVDVDGKPTLWGRWNPEYLNWFPHSIHDRRLNSAEITASLQLAFTMTGNRRYRDIAYGLFEKHGYLTNILSPMSGIHPTPGYVHEGNEMGDEWNHSDDELAFFTYWVLCRFAFTPDLKAKYLGAVRGHWDIEKAERYPIWNFIYAGCGARHYDPEGAVWTLRGTALDTLNWPVQNSHRLDITRREPNFMHRELEELLPPGERLVARINTQPFILDAGDGLTDFPGDEYLIGYWLGRQVGAIAAPNP